jgi:hypothetical protein
MKKTDCRKMTFEYCDPELKELSYSQHKKVWYGYEKIVKEGRSQVGFHYNSYGDVQYCYYGQSLFINAVEDIFREMNKVYVIDPAYEFAVRATFGRDTSFVHSDVLFQTPYAARVTTEEEMLFFLKKYKEDLLTISLPLFEGFLTDLRKVDAIINGNDYWDDDLNRGYNFGAQVNFTFRRIIIAHLCTNDKLEIFYALGKKTFESYRLGNPEGAELFLNGLEYLKKILKDITPLY